MIDMNSKNIWLKLIDRVQFLKDESLGYLSLYLFLGCALVLLTLDALFDITKDALALQIIAVLALLMIGELLYLKLLEKKQREGAQGLIQAGVSGNLDSLKGPIFEDLMSSPGKKVIVNSWLFNMPVLEPLLLKALESKTTQIEITLLAKDSQQWEGHFKYIDRSALSSVMASLDELSVFLRGLPERMRERVTVFSIDDTPRFMIHGSDDTLIVGNFWPGKRSENCPQLILRGANGSIARAVAGYCAYAASNRINITSNLLAGS